MKKMCLITLCSMAAALGESAAEEIILTVSFPPPEIIKTGRYHQVRMEGLDTMGNAGLPLLPVKPVRILLPYLSEKESVSIIPGEKIAIKGKYTVEPAQKPVPLSHGGPAERTKPDQKVYGSSTPYPQKLSHEVGVQTEKGYRFLMVNLHPVEYVPSRSQLSYYTEMTVKVTVRRAAATPQWTLPPEPEAAEEIRRSIDNPGALSTYPQEKQQPREESPLPPGNCTHVIITSEELAPSFDPLAQYRRAHGVSSTVVTTEFIDANYDGTRPDGDDDDQTRIRNFIIDAHQTWGTEYVLLGGDRNIVPPRMFWVDSLVGEQDSMPCDMYYACLDGSFDSDADGTYGEPTDGADIDPAYREVDLHAEVYVGRAPVANAAEASSVTSKTIAFEDSTEDLARLAYMVGEYIGFGGDSDYAGPSLEEIRLGSDAHDYHTDGFAQMPHFTTGTLYDAPDYEWPSGELMSIINNGVGILDHLGHADYTSCMKLSTSDLPGLANDRYFFVYSQACNSGGFDTANCFAEAITSMEKGAFAAVMNARYGWGKHDSTDGPSQRYNREFWDALFGESITQVGRMNQDSKEDNAYRISENCMRWCYYELNLFGDPAMGAWDYFHSGFVTLDAGAYAAPSTLCLSLLDTDLNHDPDSVETAIVYCASTTESTPEEVTLTENGKDSATFSGCIGIAAGPPAPDGILQVSHLDTITVTYYDEDDGSGHSAVATDTAVAILRPPEITGVQSEAGCTRARIEWGTAGHPCDSTVNYGTDPQNLSHETRDASLVTEHSIVLNGLIPETTYYFDVRSKDELGHTTVDDNGGSHHRFTTGPRTYRYVSTNGSDGDPGDAAAPWRTIGHAVSTVTDECLCPPLIRVSAGTYNERVTMRKRVELYGGYNPADWTRDITANETVIDGGGGGSVVTFDSLGESDMVLSGFTIRNGSAECGGGIYCIQSSPTIASNTIRNNSAAEHGGGIYCDRFFATLTDNTIVENSASGYGYYGKGGGMYCNHSSATLARNDVSRNSGRAGGGLYIDDSNVELSHNTIAKNSAGGSEYSGGGGILCDDRSSVVLNDNLITGNVAANYGAGIFFTYYSSATLTNTIIAHNISMGLGGGIACEESYITVINCTLAGNSSWSGGGINCIARELHYDPLMTFRNSIIWGNRALYNPQIWADPPGSVDAIYSAVEGGFEGEGNIVEDPLFVNTRTGDFRVLPGSPCIDAGTAEDAPDTDIAGDLRPHGAGVDMGAYEWRSVDEDGDGMDDAWELHYFGGLSQGPGDDYDADGETNGEECEGGTDPTDAVHPCTYYVSPHGDDSRGARDVMNNPDAPWRTIGRALGDCAVCCGDTVIVAEGTYCENIDFNGKEITLRSSDPDDAAVVSATIIDGTGRGGVVKFVSGEGPGSVLSGFTIRNGNADVQYGSNCGGGIYCMLSSPALTNNVIVSNSAQSRGGGVYCFFSSPMLANNTIESNTATAGGGISCDYESSPTLYANSIVRNRAYGVGGGMYCYETYPGYAAFSGNVVMGNHAEEGGGGLYLFDYRGSFTNNAVCYNTAADRGGGLYCDTISGCSLTLSSNTIALNSAGGSGGGIVCERYNLKVVNSILWGNQAPSGAQLYCPSPPPQLAYSDIQGGWQGTGNIDADPLFVGGVPFDYHLDAGSPCMDAGGGGIDVPDLDIDGEPRPLDIPGAGKEHTGDEYDMGADEYLSGALPTPTPRTLYVDDDAPDDPGPGDPSVSDPHEDGSLPHPFDAIQEAINTANSRDHDIVALEGTYVENINYSGKQLAIQSRNPLDPSVVEATVIDGAGRGHAVTFKTNEGPASSLCGFTVRNGAADSGAGIYCYRSSPTLAHNVITLNAASMYGGGIYCYGDYYGECSATIANNRIIENSADYSGGGICCETYYQTSARYPTISGNVITGNSAVRRGGGIYCDESSPAISNNAIADNSTEHGDGGGMYCHGSSSALTSNTIANNSTSGCGGGICIMYCESSPLTIADSILWGNGAGSGEQIFVDALSHDPVATYCDVQGGYAGEGNIDSDPLFVTGPGGDYYVSQVAAG
jgi:predicted outer membrane repeat protein